MNNKIAKLGEKTNLTKADVKNLSKIGVSGLLAVILSVFSAGWSNADAADNKPQPEKGKIKPMSERCSLKHESGPCKARFDRYYYDADTNRCKVFTYGGCEGAVPFETNQECANACVVKPGGDDANIGHKYGGVGIRDFK